MTKRCYADQLGDCEGDIEREHYFSNSALKTLGPDTKLILSGFPWLADGEQGPGSTERLWSRVLCARHNRQFSNDKVDGAGADFMTVLAEAEFGFSCRRVIRGDLFERWLLKCLCGTLAAGIIKGADSNSIRPEWLRHMFAGQAPLHVGYGLWIHARVGDVGRSRGEISFAPIGSPPYGAIMVARGIRIVFAGIRGGIEGEARRHDHLLTHAVYRPRSLYFSCPSGDSEIVLEWDDDGGGQIKIDTGLPTNPGAKPWKPPGSSRR